MASCRPKTSFGCKHYSRKCQLLAPCCGKIYACRFCHDESETDHSMEKVRKNVMLVKCSMCCTIQKAQRNCELCEVRFGKYFCAICKLFDDEDKQQFHCAACGICRVGGRENYFHCSKCNMCLNVNLRNNHICIENASQSGCPVCLDFMHTTREEIKVLKCGHLIHKSCCDDLMEKGMKMCLMCQRPM